MVQEEKRSTNEYPCAEFFICLLTAQVGLRILYENKYKKYKNKLTNIIRNCEKQFYSIELQKKENNIRGTWKVLNKILSKNKDD